MSALILSLALISKIGEDNILSHNVKAFTFSLLAFTGSVEVRERDTLFRAS